MLKLLPLLGLLFFATPVEAHQRHNHNHYQPYIWFTWQPTYFRQPDHPRIRISEHCVYKPWKNKTVCRY